MRAGHPDYQAVEQRDELDMGGIAATLARRKRLIFGATLAGAAAAFLYCLAVKPRYLAEARVLVEDQENYFNRADPSAAARELPSAMDAEAVNSQLQLLTSRDLARKAISTLHLQSVPEFDPLAGGMLSLLNFGGATTPEALEDKLLTTYFEHLTVMSPTKSRVIQIEFQARDPDLAAKAANTIAEAYIGMKQQAKRDDARRAAQSLQPQIAELERRAAEADAKVAQYRVDNGLYDAAENKSLPTQQLAEIATKLADARAAQSESQAKARSLRDLLAHGRLGDAGEISNNDLVRTIASRRSTLEAQIAADSRTLMPGHPHMKEMQAQLSDLEAQLRAAVDKAARGLENDARVGSVRVANLTALLDEQKKQVGAANGGETQLRELQRQAKVLKDQLESELAKYQAALSREDLQSTPADASVISHAVAPSQPVFPKKLPITLFGAIAGLFFSTFAALSGQLAGGAPAPVAPRPREADGFARARAAGRAATQAGAPTGAGMSARAARAPEPETDKPFLGKLKQVLSDYGAPAVDLDADRLASEPAPAPAEDVWVRNPFGAESFAGDATVGEAFIGQSLAAAPKPRRAANRVSPELIARIVHSGQGQSLTALLVEADTRARTGYSLPTARALAREGRAILVQASGDPRLDAALAGRSYDEEQAGLAQLFSGEASFAEAIYRDGASRLHVLAAGGPLDLEAEELLEVLDALRATYDFVLIAAEADALGLGLAAEADLTLILGPADLERDHLHDDFAAAGARDILLAEPAADGELIEGAA